MAHTDVQVTADISPLMRLAIMHGMPIACLLLERWFLEDLDDLRFMDISVSLAHSHVARNTKSISDMQ